MNRSNILAALGILAALILSSCDSKQSESQNKEQLDALSKQVAELRDGTDAKMKEKDNKIAELQQKLAMAQAQSAIPKAESPQPAAIDAANSAPVSNPFVRLATLKLVKLIGESPKGTSRNQRILNLKNITEIDVSGCPQDFRAAWFVFLESSNKFVEVCNSAPESEVEALLYGFQKGSEGKLDGGLNELQGRIQTAQTNMQKELTELIAVALRYGAN